VASARSLGGNATSSSLYSDIYVNTTTLVYSRSSLYKILPVNAFDSTFDFTRLKGYKPMVNIGVYPYIVPVTFNYDIGSTQDYDVSNNRKSYTAYLSDSSLCVFAGYFEPLHNLSLPSFTGSFHLHAPQDALNVSGVSNYGGTFFDIHQGLQDTITSISVCIAPGTTIGTRIQAEVYKYNPSAGTYAPMGKSLIKTLAASDISSQSNLSFISLPIDVNTAAGYTIADGGKWVAVVKPVAPGPNDALLIATAIPAAPVNSIGKYGIADTSSGTSYSFGTSTANDLNHHRLANVPAVIVNFGKAPEQTLGLSRVTGLHAEPPYPNPAHTVLYIPVTSTFAAQPRLCMYSMTGQLVLSQELGTLSPGQQKTAVCNTARLPAGNYIYSIETDGQRISGQVSIVH
jgi:hypothetical protein